MDEGLKILYKLVKEWSLDGSKVSDEELALAKEKGYIFDYPQYESHTDALKRTALIISQIDPKDIANAFLFSLSTRKLEYRSALGSYYYAKAVPEHEFMKSHNEELAAAFCDCYFCNWSAWKKNPTEYDKRYELNFLNYRRYKDGGSAVGDITLNYALFDLEQFIKLPKVIPTEEDKLIFKKILSCVNQLNDSDKAGKLRDKIIKSHIFKTNKDQVSVLLGELGICGILAGKDYPSYDVRFANEYERDPVEYRNDFAYPLNRWYARDGINKNKLKEVFGDEFLFYT